MRSKSSMSRTRSCMSWTRGRVPQCRGPREKGFQPGKVLHIEDQSRCPMTGPRCQRRGPRCRGQGLDSRRVLDVEDVEDEVLESSASRTSPRCETRSSMSRTRISMSRTRSSMSRTRSSTSSASRLVSMSRTRSSMSRTTSPRRLG